MSRADILLGHDPDCSDPVQVLAVIQHDHSRSHDEVQEHFVNRFLAEVGEDTNIQWFELIRDVPVLVQS